MQENSTLSEDIRTRNLDSAEELIASGDPSTTINQNYHANMENGEGMVGYQYLHGTNATVGDFQRSGTATQEINADGSGTITFDMEYGWNDVIDPNPQYSTDRWKSTIAEIVTLGLADPYDIHINWNETTIVEFDSSGNITRIRNAE